jgi:hypothetical protein
MKKIFVIAIAAMALASCTENERARRFGGVEEVELKPNEVVLNVTWKENEMWICTKDTTTNTVYLVIINRKLSKCSRCRDW